MRIWDISPSLLCRQHLLAEHRELHGLWNILTVHQGRGGYSNHPETKRWQGKRMALYQRHQALVREFKKRGYQHFSDLDIRYADGCHRQDVLLNSLAEQKQILKNKSCPCLIKYRK